MSFARTTQPMAVPWLAARHGQAARLLVTLERRVTLVVEDGLNPVADLYARVFAMELVALLTVEAHGGDVLEQRRVRAHASDIARFTGAVLEQIELACNLCPGIGVAVTRDQAPIWHPLHAGLSTLVVEGERVPVTDVVDRPHLAAQDLELTRRARRRPVTAIGTAPPPFR